MTRPKHTFASTLASASLTSHSQEVPRQMQEPKTDPGPRAEGPKDHGVDVLQVRASAHMPRPASQRSSKAAAAARGGGGAGAGREGAAWCEDLPSGRRHLTA